MKPEEITRVGYIDLPDYQHDAVYIIDTKTSDKSFEQYLDLEKNQHSRWAVPFTYVEAGASSTRSTKVVFETSRIESYFNAGVGSGEHNSS